MGWFYIWTVKFGVFVVGVFWTGLTITTGYFKVPGMLDRKYRDVVCRTVDGKRGVTAVEALRLGP